jgi:hypothetical protein
MAMTVFYEAFPTNKTLEKAQKIFLLREDSASMGSLLSKCRGTITDPVIHIASNALVSFEGVSGVDKVKV